MPRANQNLQPSPSGQRLIDAAIELICERGIAGSSVDAICKRAGAAKSAVYWHFGSKDDLLIAVMHEVSRVCVTELKDAVYAATDPLDRLNRLIGGLKNLVDLRSQHMQVKQAVITERGNISAEVFEVGRRFSRLTLQTIAQGFEDAMGRPVTDPDLIAHTIISLTHGALRMKILDPEWTDTERLFDDLRNTVVLLIAARSGG